ncbi:hypothetical protein CRUP_015531 [Coryphaenoides rupestris]|nr:hypothetical protein CRUP_015531 [Coryphaenoides rupestris]
MNIGGHTMLPPPETFLQQAKMAAAALVTENFKFVSLFFKSKDVMIFNGLIALGTVASQTMYNVFAFNCPCSPERNHRYGLAAIGVPALALFLLGVMLNRGTWDLLSECRIRRCRKLAPVAGFALTGNIVGRAAIAPVTWVVISLLQGEAYLCALSEFIDPNTLEGFPPQLRPVAHLMAKFPCKGAVASELLSFLEEIERRLKYESQSFLAPPPRPAEKPVVGKFSHSYWRSYHAASTGNLSAAAKMAAAALVTENFKFVSLFFKSKDVMIFNGLIALGTVASQTMYNVFAFNCPCSPERNHRYGLAAIGVPALALFLLGVMLNRGTWDLLSECRIRRCRKLAPVAGFALTGNIVGRAAIAPVTWVVISLLQGEAYLCALSEFIDPNTLEGFPPQLRPVAHLMAKFPCKGAVASELLSFLEEIERRLKYESQRCCCSPFGYQQEEYWGRFHASERELFQRTAAAHASLRAADNVERFFGFVLLDAAERAEAEAYAGAAAPVPSADWNRVTGVYLYRGERRRAAWARYHVDNNMEGMVKEMDVCVCDSASTS